MTKKDYLNQLQHELLKKLNYDETKSILADYNDFFETELAQGKQEQDELCIKFGNPADVAKEILLFQDKRGNIIPKYFLSYSVLFLPISLLLFLQSIFANNIILSILLGVLIPFVFMKWLKWHENNNKNLIPLKINLKLIKVTIFIPLIISILIWLFKDGIVVWIYMFSGFSTSFINVTKTGPSATYNLNLIYFACLSGLFIRFIHAYENGINKKFSIAFLFVGFMQSSLCIKSLLGNLSALDLFINNILRCLLPIAIGGVLWIISERFLKHTIKTGK